MIVGVMQPYLFPYLGYYQLVHHCSHFVFYDDVNFIKGGYINRNNILSNGNKQLFTLPVVQASSFKKINSLDFQLNSKKIIKTIEQAYSKSPYFNDVMPLITNILNSSNRNVSSMASDSIVQVFEYLGVEKAFYHSSKLEYNREQSAADKLYAICDVFNANKYCNSLGGQTLYSKSDFLEKGIDLSFIKMNSINYSQGKNEFVDHLSMIDVLMWNSKEEIIELLGQYQIK
ncbi:WbqC family protein [Thalassotalea sp. ND16A]|uniref:WbqC family protein n=1 Tax=Thalassotalea sp. ND16A TaxID=1535422 RepID=UPI00051A70D4|nr:WbqC family protein [Thalassotalea sp. ND16A]KGJ90192.1 hypothetical protein ND16A_2042 [Thalassotalea sp. ND16A]